jgi:hypothetical protein
MKERISWRELGRMNWLLGLFLLEPILANRVSKYISSKKFKNREGSKRELRKGGDTREMERGGY